VNSLEGFPPLKISIRHTATISAFLLIAFAPSIRAQLPLAQSSAPASLDDRRKALNSILREYKEDLLKHDPEFASEHGDQRYNDQISDYSVSAFHDKLARETNFMLQLAAIDPDGFTEQETAAKDQLLRKFADDLEASDLKEWEIPFTSSAGIQTIYPDLVAKLSFTTVKDYDDWIARLHLIPTAFDQVTENMSIGIEDHHLPSADQMAKVLDQVKQLAGQKPEDSPFALPLKSFPSTVNADEQARIKDETLSAIGKEVLPAYIRFARFLEVTYIPACQQQPAGTKQP
jgi:uncharacterized protein (DUF885 family)